MFWDWVRDWPWVEIGWWMIFLAIIIMGGWYLYWCLSMPFWYFEPVLKRNDVSRWLFGSSPWKRIGYSKYHLENVVSFCFSNREEQSGYEEILAEEERKEVCEKWCRFLSHTQWVVFPKSKWNASCEEVLGGFWTGEVCVSCLGPISNTISSKSGCLENGWIVTQSFSMRRWKGGNENDWWASLLKTVLDGWWGDSGEEDSGKERWWNVLSLCVVSSASDSAKTDKTLEQSLTRKLFHTHMARTVFAKPLLGGLRGCGKINGGMFRHRWDDKTMKGVIPFVTFEVVEMKLDLEQIRPFTKRELKRLGSTGRGQMVRVTELLLRQRKWMDLLWSWYQNMEKGKRVEWIGVVDWDVLLSRILYEFLYLFLWVFPMDEGEEMAAIYVFRNEKRIENEETVGESDDNKLRKVVGMRINDKKRVTWMATWINPASRVFDSGLRSLEMRVAMETEIGWLGFRFALSELIRIDHCYCLLQIEALGLNAQILGLLDSGVEDLERWFDKRGREIGQWIGSRKEAYYLYNRFLGTFSACDFFLVI